MQKPLTLDPGEFTYTRSVQFAETDLAGIVHFSAFFRYMEEAEHALWRAAGLSVAGDGLHWPRVVAYCDYTNPLRFEDEITVKVRAGFGRRRIQIRIRNPARRCRRGNRRDHQRVHAQQRRRDTRIDRDPSGARCSITRCAAISAACWRGVRRRSWGGRSAP